MKYEYMLIKHRCMGFPLEQTRGWKMLQHKNILCYNLALKIHLQALKRKFSIDLNDDGRPCSTYYMNDHDL